VALESEGDGSGVVSVRATDLMWKPRGGGGSCHAGWSRAWQGGGERSGRLR
jgi:hypothetical protein